MARVRGSGETVDGRTVPGPHVGLVAVFAGFALFGSSPALVAGATLAGLVVALWRALISTVVFSVVGWARSGLDGAVRYGVAPGLTFGLATGIFFEAAQRTSVANAAIIAAMQPIPMMAAARFVFDERVGRVDVAWFLLALVGAVAMVLATESRGTASMSGNLLAMVSTLFSAGYFVTSRRSRAHLDAVPLMAGSMLWSAVILTPTLLIAGESFTLPEGGEWLRIVAIALLPGAGHVLIAYSQRTVPLVVIGLAQLLMPVSAATLAWLFLDQAIGLGQFAGMALVIFSLAAHTVYRSRLAVERPALS